MRYWSRRALLLGGAICVCAACTHNLSAHGGYSISVRGEDNRVSLAASQDADDYSGEPRYTAFIDSPQGIGEALFVWWGKDLPHHVTFVLALQGLEDFRLAWADHIVVVSVNSANRDVIQSAVTRTGGEQPLTADSPLWMDIELPGAEQPNFRIGAPQSFIEDAPRVWSIAWIDYYR